METETIKFKRRLSPSMGDLYLLKDEKDILNRPDINRGYVMALSQGGNLYSYSFALCDEPHEVGELDKIVVEKILTVENIVPIPFDVDDTRGGNSSDLEKYLNRHFRNKLQILKTESGIELFRRSQNINLVKVGSLLNHRENTLPLKIRKELLFYSSVGNNPIIEYIVI